MWPPTIFVIIWKHCFYYDWLCRASLMQWNTKKTIILNGNENELNIVFGMKNVDFFLSNRGMNLFLKFVEFAFKLFTRAYGTSIAKANKASRRKRIRTIALISTLIDKWTFDFVAVINFQFVSAFSRFVSLSLSLVLSTFAFDSLMGLIRKFMGSLWRNHFLICGVPH